LGPLLAEQRYAGAGQQKGKTYKPPSANKGSPKRKIGNSTLNKGTFIGYVKKQKN